MKRILRPSRLGVRLGWARVAVRFVAEGAERAEERIGDWAMKHQDRLLASFPPRSGGTWTASTSRDPLRLAEELQLVQTGGLTDLGNVLREVDSSEWSEETGPFKHSLDIRWVLWCALARADGGFWSEAFTTWQAGSEDDVWMLRIAEQLRLDGDDELAKIITSLKYKQLKEKQISPRFGAVRDLGWNGRLEALRRCSSTLSATWSDADILSLFQVAESLAFVPPTPERLVHLLQTLPPALRGVSGASGTGEAPWREVWTLLVAKSFKASTVEDWRSSSASLEPVGIQGVYLKAGGSTDSPNIAWEALPPVIGEEPLSPQDNTPAGREGPHEDSQPEPVPHLAPEANGRVSPVIHQQGLEVVTTKSEGQNGEVGGETEANGSSPPVVHQPPLEVATTTSKKSDTREEQNDVSGDSGGVTKPTDPEPKRVRAESWTRMAAWWSRGLTFGDLLVFGHGSRRLLLSILRDWTTTAAKGRFTKRTDPLTILGTAKEKQVAISAEMERCRLPGDGYLWSWVAAALRQDPEVDFTALQAAVRTLPSGDFLKVSAAIREWLDGSKGSTQDIERWTRVWLDDLRGRHLLTPTELQYRIRALPPDDAIASAKRLLDQLEALEGGAGAKFRVEGELICDDPRLSLPDSPWSCGEVEFNALEYLAPAPRRISWSLPITGASAEVAKVAAGQMAVDTFSDWATPALPRAPVAGLMVRTTFRVFNEAQDEVSAGPPPDPKVSVDTGWGWWGNGGWFTQLPDIGIAQLHARMRSQVTRSRREAHPVDALAHLWYAIEHTVEGGDDGYRVVRQVSAAAAACAVRAIREDIGALSALGTPEEGESAWRQSLLTKADTDKKELAKLVRNAMIASAWLLQAAYSVRNQLVHEADRGQAAEEVVLRSLLQSADLLVCRLGVEYNRRGTWEVVAVPARAVCANKTEHGDTSTIPAKEFIRAFGFDEDT